MMNLYGGVYGITYANNLDFGYRSDYTAPPPKFQTLFAPMGERPISPTI
jgi:hypothetical protein